MPDRPCGASSQTALLFEHGPSNGPGAGHRWAQRDQGRRGRGDLAAGQPPRLGPLRRRVPVHPRGVPRRRRLRVGAGGPHRGRHRPARRRHRQARARARLRRRPVLALGDRARRPAVGLDLSLRQLQHSRRIDAERGTTVPAVCATATAAPVRRRHLRHRLLLVRRAAVRRRRRRRGEPRWPGCCGRAAASPSRSPTRPGGCSPTTPARAACWPRSPTGTGRRTSRSTTRAARSATSSTTAPSATGSPCWPGPGWSLVRFDEPEWPEHHDRTWGGWSRTRGLLTPGTAIFVAELR